MLQALILCCSWGPRVHVSDANPFVWLKWHEGPISVAGRAEYHNRGDEPRMRSSTVAQWLPRLWFHVFRKKAAVPYTSNTPQNDIGKCLPGPPKEPKIMAQYPKIKSIGSIGSIILAILWRSR